MGRPKETYRRTVERERNLLGFQSWNAAASRWGGPRRHTEERWSGREICWDSNPGMLLQADGEAQGDIQKNGGAGEKSVGIPILECCCKQMGRPKETYRRTVERERNLLGFQSWNAAAS